MRFFETQFALKKIKPKVLIRSGAHGIFGSFCKPTSLSCNTLGSAKPQADYHCSNGHHSSQ